MDVSEFLRQLADIIDAGSKEESAVDDEEISVDNAIVPAPQPQVVAPPVEQPAPAPISDETETMVPPLQQEIELLKKLAGVESVYTPECKCEGECTCEKPQTAEQELAVLKKNSGLALTLTRNPVI